MWIWILPVLGLLYFVAIPPAIYGSGKWLGLLMLGVVSIWMTPWYITLLYGAALARIALRSRSLAGIMAATHIPPTIDVHAAKFLPHPELSKPNQMSFELQFVQEQLSDMVSLAMKPQPPQYTRYKRR